MLKSRKLLFLLGITSLCALFFSGCTAGLPDQIAPAELTADQQNIIDLLQLGGQEILFFDFETETAYTEVEFWVDIYESGAFLMIANKLHISAPEPMPLNGRLAITINHDSGQNSFQWQLNISSLSSKIIPSASVSNEPVIIDYNPLAWARGSITGPIAIEDGQEIILHILTLSSTGVFRVESSDSNYLELPEAFEQYPYAFIIRARFSN